MRLSTAWKKIVEIEAADGVVDCIVLLPEARIVYADASGHKRHADVTLTGRAKRKPHTSGSAS